MLTLLKTLLGIIQFRLGPDAIPRSTAVFSIVIAWWFVVGLIGVLLDPEAGIRSMLNSALVSLPGLLVYSVLVQANGKGDRVLQMLSAVIGCGTLFSLALTVLFAIVVQLPGDGEIPLLAVLSLWIIMLWSVAIDGHILSRTLNFPRAFGTAVAIAVFVFQYYLFGLFSTAS